jgi:hypothetical protein
MLIEKTRPGVAQDAYRTDTSRVAQSAVE